MNNDLLVYADVQRLNINTEEESLEAIPEQSRDIEGVIKNLCKLYDEWVPLGERANAGKWELLGQVYEAAPLVDCPGHDRDALVKEIRNRWAIDPKRWNGDKRNGHELFVTLLFGNSDNRPTKSQWKKALDSAGNRGIPRDRQSFVAYMNEVGGIAGAITERIKGTGPSKSDRIDRIKAWSSLRTDLDSEPVSVPAPIGPDELEGLVLTIGRVDRGRAGEGDYRIHPIASTADPSAIVSFISVMDRQIADQEMEGIKERNSELRIKVNEVHKRMQRMYRKDWKSLRKDNRTRYSLLQFARDREGLDPYSREIPSNYMSMFE